MLGRGRLEVGLESVGGRFAGETLGGLAVTGDGVVVGGLAGGILVAVCDALFVFVKPLVCGRE